MTSKLVLFFILSAIASINAQDITSDWQYKVGEVVVENRFLDLPFTWTLEGGIETTWDFSAFNEAIQIVDTVKYVLPDGLENSEKYPEANMARIRIASPLGSTTIAYYEVSDEKIDYLGITLRPNAYSIQDPIYRVANFPLFIGENISQFFVEKYYMDNQLNSEYTYMADITYDGIGTVITPSGTYEDCAMIVATLFNLDGTVFREIISYHQGSLVNKITQITNYIEEESSDFQYQVAYTSSTQEAKEQLDINIIQLGNSLQITSDKEGVYQAVFFSMDGKVIDDLQFLLKEGETIIDHNLARKQAYALMLIDKHSGQFSSHKLVLK